MPLPANSSIPLQGHSRPGEGVPTKPKIAMIVRMTEETLDALQNLSSTDRMDFDFGDKPGIHIREEFFPMQYNKEKENQELFIRTTMSARPNAALRLNANVVGKFVVERVLLDKALQRMRDTKAAADKQKSERKAILVDTPPIMPTVTQKSVKRKAPPKSTPQSVPTIVKSYASAVPSMSTLEARGSPSSTSFPKDVVALFRQRLVHYLALGPATQPDIVKNVGGVEAERDVRLKITEILSEVAEQEQVGRKTASASASTKWLLKPQTWREVRPYQYQDYTDNVRTSVARSARTWLKTLKVPENDPAWDHVRFRSNGVSGATNTGAVQRAVNGTSTAAEKAKTKKNREVKPKDVQTKIKSEATIPPARPPPPPAPVALPRPNPPAESTIPTARIGKVKDRDAEKEEGELSAPETPPRVPAVPSNRLLPGSRSNGTATPTMMLPPPVPFTSQAPVPSQSSMAPPPKRTGPVDARSSKRPPPEQSERARPVPSIPPPAPTDRKPVVQVKKEVVKKERAVPAKAAAANGVGAGVAGSSAQSVRDREVVKRERERDRIPEESVRSVKREKDRESDRESIRGRERESDRERPREKEGDRAREKDLRERERERERDRERERERAARIRERERERERETDRAGGKGKERERPLTNTAVKAGTKRKLAEDSGDDSSDWGIEDRKHARKSVNGSSTKVKYERESMPAKASSSSLKVLRRESSPPRKIKRESPLPPSKSAPSVSHKVSQGSSTAPRPIKKEIKVERDREVSSRPASAKPPKKRRSPTYTSSSEEEEEDMKPKKAKTAPKPSAPAPRRPVRPLPALSKHENLRSRYSSTYNEYLLAFQKLVAQKSKLTAMLRQGSVSGSGESDGDTDMLSIEELEELSARHQRLHDELESIKKNYMT